MAASVLVTNGTVVTPLRVIPAGGVLIESGRIVRVEPIESLPAPSPDTVVVDAAGGYIAPGFVDIHVHGGGGADVMDATAQSLHTIAQCHAAGGTTSFVPTTVTAPLDRLIEIMDVVAEEIGRPTGGARVLGVHLEGPFLSPAEIGAHRAADRCDPAEVDYGPLLAAGVGVKRLTLAPELAGAVDLIRRAAHLGWHVAMGHSTATGHTLWEAIGAGCKHVTHLFSCTSGLHKEEGYKQLGINEHALLADDLTVELIADGHHLGGELAAMVIAQKGAYQTCLVTDAMRAAGMPPGRYDLGGLPVIVEDGVAKLPDRSGFAGSVATMGQLVREVVGRGGLGIARTIASASLWPATLVGLGERKGLLAPGRDADVVVLNSSLEIQATIVAGEVVYRSGA